MNLQGGKRKEHCGNQSMEQSKYIHSNSKKMKETIFTVHGLLTSFRISDQLVDGLRTLTTRE